MNSKLTNQQPRGLLRLFLRMPILLYHAHLGWLLGGRFLMLTHTGRKSGKPRQVVLEVVHHDAETDTYFVAAGWRGKVDWFRNIQIRSAVQIMAGSRSLKATAVVMQLVKAAATFYIYARHYPLAFRELSRIMMGEVLQPNQEDCFRLAKSVPLVKLMPAQPVIME